MSNSWLRLWHDMPNDPKWRTIARASGEPLALVISVYMHLLVDASRNVTRGHVDVTNEDLASALDVTESQIEAIMSAMDGRVLDGRSLSGWEKRQPKREDQGDELSGAKSASQRKKEQREREKQEKEALELEAQNSTVTQCHEVSRNVTLDKDKDKEYLLAAQHPQHKSEKQKAARLPKDWVLPKSWGKWTIEEMGWDELSVRREAEKFRDFWIAKGGRDAAKLDWEATWRNWCRNAKVATPAAGASLLAGGI